MLDEKLSLKDVELSIGWIVAHPDPLICAVPRELRQKWLVAAQAVLDTPLESAAFTIYVIGRLEAELRHRRPGTGVTITEIDPAPELSRYVLLNAANGAAIEISATTLVAEFGAWTQKLALSLICDTNTFAADNLALFRFLPDEVISIRKGN